MPAATSSSPGADAQFFAHFDGLEAQDPTVRESRLMAALPQQVAHARASTDAFRELLASIDPARINSRAALATLPVLRKADLAHRQHAARDQQPPDPFGGLSAIGWSGLRRSLGARRVFQSPGPIYEPQGWGRDGWRMARALHAAGVRSGELVHNSFSYHLTPAGAMMECGAEALGCTVFPGGVGNTELQLQAMVDLQPQAYVGTPSFLKILVDRAQQQGLSLPLRKALVSGEAFPPSLRDWLIERGVAAFQCYATADLGLIAYETQAREGLVLDESVIVEIVRPGTGDPVAEGEVGELVVTTLTSDYPLIRFGTGDLSALLPGRCPSGRTNTRIRGWMGRADQSAKVRGMFVHASQVAEVLKRFPEVVRGRLVIEGEMAQDRMTLQVEVDGEGPEGLPQRLAEALRDVTKLRGEVVLLPLNGLPNDGKVIEDLRRYE
ncbi:phenylacetate--CoA ligase family protein [Roseateles amylovorans]|uniref:AMP-binding protein n=1 Tax=Roseateles amylovorans TaxID=2978473 RepID=A0ABY6BA85_9BURK|nr:AMP-binding protein [Roseateles amylovorans]UXH80827.1 AMP-binding protein [Roseateles amylovorans]